MLKLHEARQLRAVSYDPWQLASVAARWVKAGIKCIEMPQTAQRTEADTALYNAIVSGSIRHYNEPELNDAVKNAIVAETPRGMRITKEKATKKIDPLVALSMAHHAALTVLNYGGVEILPFNLYEGFGDYLKAGKQWVFAPKASHKAHPQGVTWRNCKHRMKGCAACVAELESEGEYQRQDEELRLSLARGAGQPMSEQEAIQELLSSTSILWTLNQQEQQEAQDAKIIRKFWKAVRLGS